MGSQYCFPSDLVNQINPIALNGISTPQQTAACQEASEIADSYMRGRYALPLLAWGADIVTKTAQVAVYLLMAARGYNPSAGADDLIRIRYEDAIGWFQGIQRQNTHPDVTPSVAQPGDPTHDLPQVRTSPQRGWANLNARGIPSV
jgi:phage gp36-like protein